jgi:hypothetical protein
MGLIEGLVAYLLTQAPITSVIAGGNSIQPIPAPVDAASYPAIVYQMPSDIPDYTLTGPAGLSHSRIMFSCLVSYGPGSYLTAHNLGLAVKDALSGYIGTLPDGPRVFFAEVVNVTDVFQPDALLSATNVSVLFHYAD